MRGDAPEGQGSVSRADAGVVWLLDDPALPPRPVPVKVLLNNGSDAAVEPLKAGDLTEGGHVVTRATEVVSGKGGKVTNAGAGQGGDTSNPFLPKMPKPPKRAGGPPPG